MKVAVIGLGAIGKRHFENIMNMGHDVYAVDVNPRNTEFALGKCRGVFTSVKDCLKINPEAAIICTYNNGHVKIASECINAGMNIFIEKPLSSSMAGIDLLINACRKKKAISLVGCNMRFHPGIKIVNEVLRNKAEFKKILWAGLEFGYYLPFAKPEYEKSYIANKKLGGNIILDCIHELDYAIWFMGRPVKVFCTCGVLSDLNIDTQDQAELIVEFESGAVCNVHFDYLQHGYSRHCKIVAKEGTVWWDFVLGKVGIVTKKENKWAWKNARAELYYNQMFIDEMKYFFSCIKENKKTMNPVEDAAKTLELALAAQKSSKSGRWEKVGV